MHTDCYGRTWRFKPGHDTSTMLQISRDLARAGYNANAALTFGDYSDRYAKLEGGGPLEPYLLKLGDNWYMGMRWGDEGSEYYSPGLSDSLIELMLKRHNAEACSEAEQRAIYHILTKD